MLTADQEEHGAILEMAASVKMIIRQTALAKSQGAEKSLDDIDIDDVIVSLMADLQQIQDRETEGMINHVQDKVMHSSYWVILSGNDFGAFILIERKLFSAKNVFLTCKPFMK